MRVVVHVPLFLRLIVNAKHSCKLIFELYSLVFAICCARAWDIRLCGLLRRFLSMAVSRCEQAHRQRSE